MEHKDRLFTLGENARKLYDEIFSIDSFEKNLLSIINDLKDDKQ